jgi:hypothetical protein
MKIFNGNYYKEILSFLNEADEAQVVSDPQQISSENVSPTTEGNEPVDAGVEQENINNSKEGLNEAETAMQTWTSFNELYSQLKSAMDKAQIQSFDQLKELLNGNEGSNAETTSQTQ